MSPPCASQNRRLDTSFRLATPELYRLSTKIDRFPFQSSDLVVPSTGAIAAARDRQLRMVRSTGRANTLTFEQEVECYGTTSKAALEPLAEGRGC
jgi:hypothetical protein